MQSIQPRVLAIRAISSRYVLEIIRPLFIVACLIVALLFSLVIYLSVALTPWWALFLLPLVPVSSFVIVVSIAATALARAIAPIMTKKQRRVASDYVRNMHQVNDGLRTPQFMIIFKILVDLFKRRWQGGFIHQTTVNSVRLKKDFDDLVTSFEASSRG